MDLYQTNIKFLTKHYPALLKVIDDAEEERKEEAILTRNNEPNLVVTSDGNSYFLHSRYNAKEEAKRWIVTLKEKIESQYILIVGIGLGFFLEELLVATKAKHIFIHEPSSEVFNTWLKVKDTRAVLSDPRIKLFAVGNDEYLPLQIANEIAGIVSGPFCMITPPIYEKLYPGTIAQLDLELKDMIIQQISNMQTRKEYQETWLNNILGNISHMSVSPSISELKDIWKDNGVKAIVVGSGPSLKKDIHYLSGLKDKCLIIAAGSSIQAMEHFGVYPHVVVSMDGSLSNYEVFNNIDTSKVPLIFLPPVHYKITDHYEGPMYHAKFNNDLITNHIYDQENIIPGFISTSTVTGTAIQLAEYMGITQIMLMGQDLSFPDDEYYAPGVNHISENSKEAHISHADLWVDNVEGGKNRTKGSMQVLLKDIQVLVKIMKFRGVDIINTSKKGAVIEGTEWVSMDELTPRLQQEPSRSLEIASGISALSLETQLDNISRSTTNLTKALQQISKMDIKLKKLLKLMTKLENAITARNLNQVNRVLDEINTLWKWTTNQEIFNVFYNYSLGHYINIYMRHVPEIVDTQESFEKGRLIIRHLGKLVEEISAFNPELNRAIDEAKSKLDLSLNKLQTKNILIGAESK
ncbi:6-hydroxymethylpterin diphosphokinase MptE-like protein [Paenibacillus sp. CGMCC 1.18879]|uniref:motility associated factor glycosyltransferase family protein n=1 Tax=Paenibacillus sp. CGMCC 1.18879 TaxID=2834466 RepID=UPI001CAA29ED|nr:6-hydroxymethylpterin diphosphokinase MptE-like protein [Paenibacillus sp. CGMCC 1.18879]MBY9077600.1 motility associated factor glycosyltransferase family protein [Paenibacillus sp. CGMCC 1.18879]